MRVRPSDHRWVCADDVRVQVGIDERPAPPPRPVSDRPLNESLVAVGLPYPVSDRQQALACLARVIPVLRGIRVVGCAAGDMAAVALGHCDGFVGFGLAEWDTAAGEVIVRTNGGQVRKTRSTWGPPLLIAGAPQLVRSLEERLGASQKQPSGSEASNSVLTNRSPEGD